MTYIHNMVTHDFNGESPDVLFAFSGGIVRDEKTGAYRTLTWSDLSEHGLATGGRTRVIAAVEIASIFPDIPVVTNSFNRFDPNEPSMASVIGQEMIDRGVEPWRIVHEEKSFSTITQLTEMVKLAVEIPVWRNITVVINEYHYPRTTGMFERLDTIIDSDEFQQTLWQFRANGTRVSFINAEPVLRAMNSHFAYYVAQAEQSPGFQAMVAAEAQGLQDLEAGNYRVTLTPEQPRY